MQGLGRDRHGSFGPLRRRIGRRWCGRPVGERVGVRGGHGTWCRWRSIPRSVRAARVVPVNDRSTMTSWNCHGTRRNGVFVRRIHVWDLGRRPRCHEIAKHDTDGEHRCGTVHLCPRYVSTDDRNPRHDRPDPRTLGPVDSSGGHGTNPGVFERRTLSWNSRLGAASCEAPVCVSCVARVLLVVAAGWC
jgi:hypothetical protein